jgi:hypothetical protein
MNRRLFLQGGGVCIALPAMASLGSWRARAHGVDAAPQRLVVIGHPNGTSQQLAGDVEVPPPLLARLEPLAGRYTVVKNINDNGVKLRQQQTGIGTPHSACFHGFLSGHTHPSIGAEHQTFDQILAEQPQHQGARAGSISINCGKRPSAQEGVPQQWFNTWAWKGPAQPVSAYHDPREVFELLFAGFEPEEDPVARRRLERKQLYLDAVVDQIEDLRPRLGQTDKVRLDEYLTGVEELDRKTTQLLEGGALLECMVGAAPEIDLPPDSVTTPTELYPQVLELMQDLVLLALQCDSTRIVTFAHASPAGGGGMDYHPFVTGLEGTETGWHPLSHWSAPYGTLSPDPEVNRRDFERVIAWHYDRVVELVQKLEATTDTEGRSLLDDTLVVFGSWMGAAVHTADHLYQILFGSGGGRFRMGEVVSANPGTDRGPKEIADLWSTVMRGFDVDATLLGTGEAGIDELLA